MIQSSYELIKSIHSKALGTILYFHGGGFMASTPYDLPKYQREYFKDFDMFLIDYPLAPQNTLTSILESVESIVDQLFEDELYNQGPIIFYGRSAGSYMASYVYARRKAKNLKNASGLVLFYGYYHFEDNQFNQPSMYYRGKSRLDELSATQILEQKLTLSSRMNRLLVYMYAREKGRWLDYLGIDRNTISHFNLESTLVEFPLTFLAASIYDPDVNVEYTKQMVSQIKEVTVFYSQSNEHAFDQVEDEDTKHLFSSIVLFLQTIIRREVKT